MSTAPLLVLGSANRKKAVELANLFAPIGVRLETLADYEEALDVVEDGDTFAENSAKKAVQQATHLDRWVLAEDSGLAVDALDGAPGVYSARFSGPRATDESNTRLLLEKLESIPPDRRTAHYVCQMTLCDRSGAIRAESEGCCAGRIVLQPRGSNGFGYDPVFEVIEYHRTFGELSAAVKACLSHRAPGRPATHPPLADSTGRLRPTELTAPDGGSASVLRFPILHTKWAADGNVNIFRRRGSILVRCDGRVSSPVVGEWLGR